MSSAGTGAAWGGCPRRPRLRLTPDLPVFGAGSGAEGEGMEPSAGGKPTHGLTEALSQGWGWCPRDTPEAPWGCPHPPHPPP